MSQLWLQGREGRRDMGMLPAPSSARGRSGDGAGEPHGTQDHNAQHRRLNWSRLPKKQPRVGIEHVLARKSESNPVSSSAGSEWIL